MISYIRFYKDQGATVKLLTFEELEPILKVYFVKKRKHKTVWV